MNTKSIWFAGWMALGALVAVHAAVTDDFAELQKQIKASRKWDLTRLRVEAHRSAALIHPEDRSPVDIVLRRTQALLADLSNLPGAPGFEKEKASLATLAASAEEAQAKALPDEAGLRKLFQQITVLRRQVAFQNPLLNFESIIFLKHGKQVRGYRHMVDQYLGFNAGKTGGVYRLRQPFSDQPVAESILAESRVQNGRLRERPLENRGSFIGLDLDYDGKSLLFAFTEAEYEVPGDANFDNQYCRREDLARDKGALHHFFRPESTYHIFQAQADGSNLRQLTDGMWNDYDPCYLPSGRIAFVSERAGGQVRCGMRPLPSATLHAMMPDGQDIIQLSWHDTQEWHPSVGHDGRLVYTRWDYVDRDSDVAHHIWTCQPDGRDPRSAHGNYPERRELRPWMEMSIRAIPGSHRYVAVATPHHGEAYGSLVILDPRQPDDRATAQVRRLTPEVPFPESESQPGVPHDKGTHSPAAEVYGTPWPLSENYFLCVYDAGQTNYAICLLDAFGNREILYRDPAIACLDPMPLMARPRPPVLPSATLQAGMDRAGEADLAYGTVAIMNVYDSRIPFPPGVQISAIRVINIFPKDNPFMDDPNIGYSQALCRGVLGTAPVEADGSAHFKLPAGAPVYFQLLDPEGLAVQTMRSDTYVHPGETLTCAGCHESSHRSPQARPGIPPLALRRPPSMLAPEAAGSFPLTFPRLVQPTLDAKCVGCHDADPKAPGLHGDRFAKHGWSEAYHSLVKFAWGMSGGNGVAIKERQYSVPMQDGARVSKLYRLISQDHHGLKLTAAELRPIIVWLDCNSNFYGAYTDPEKQARGEAVQPVWGLPKWTDPQIRKKLAGY
jgi:cytochrome c553